MKIKTLLFLIAISFLNSAFAQSVNFEWAVQLGNKASLSIVANSNAVDANGNVFNTGLFQGTVDFDPGPNTINLTSSGGTQDMFISKFDSYGNLLWAKSIGGLGLEFGNSITLDVNNNIYIAGSFQNTVDFNPGIGVANLTSTGGYDIFILKLDSNGNFIWVSQTGGNLNDHAYSICIDINGNVYTTGSFQSTADFDPGNGTLNLTSSGNNDIFISKLNSSGVLVWAKSMGGVDDDRGYSLDLDGMGNLVVSGQFTGTVDFDPGPNVFVLNALGSSTTDIFILKLDNNGNFIWAKKVGGTGNDHCWSLKTDSSNNVIATGHFTQSVDFDPGTGVANLTSSGGYDIFILKLDISGNFIWARKMGGISNNDQGRSLFVDQLGNIYTTGFFSGTADFDPGNGTSNLISVGGNDIFISKLDNLGNFVWVKQIGGLSEDLGNGIAVDELFNIHITGSYNSTVDFDPNVGVFDMTTTQSSNFELKLSQCQVQSIDTQVACNSFTWIDGITYTSSNNAVSYTLQNAQGCDSTITLNLTITQPTSSTITETTCEAFTLNNQTYTQSGTYTQQLTNTQGCDSTITLNLTITQPTTNTITQTACSSFTLNNQTYTQSGTYTQQLTNAQGCDSTITLNLTITQPTSNTITQTACSSFTLNNQTYTQSGTYTQQLTNAQGCDSTITLNLTIAQPTSSTITETTCEAFTLNNQTYTQSGTYTQQLTNAEGCDSTITLNLTITQPTSNTITQTACSSFSLNNQTYTQSGTYTQQLTNTQGCDSTITLNLTITQPTSSTITEAACEAFTLNNQTYEQSGTYTQQLTNTQGCDSTITLNLTISQPTSSSQTQSAIDSYTWPVNGQTYTESGIYSATIPNAAGCDSTITLNLTLGFSGIMENEVSKIIVYPNPTENFVSIEVSEELIYERYILLDFYGRIILEGKFSAYKNNIDMSKLSKGTYLLKVNDQPEIFNITKL